VSHNVRAEGEGGSVPGAQAAIAVQPLDRLQRSRCPHCSPWRTPCWSGWMFPEGTESRGDPMLEQIYPAGIASCGRDPAGAGSRMRRKEQQRGAVMD